MNKRRLIITLLAVLLVIAVPGSLYWLMRRALPPLDGSLSVAGLESSAKVFFDSRGVPYIEAHTDADAYTAQGYTAARDRLFQMDMLRRSALGQMSEVFGASWLPTDRLIRTLGIKQLAYDEFDKLDAPAKAALESYAQGVNDFIADYSGKMPIEFVLLGYRPRDWRAEDSLALLKYQAYQIDESWRLDDFRQRVANRVGDEMADQLFADNLLSQQPKGAPKISSLNKPTPAWSACSGQLLSRLAVEADAAHAPINVGPFIGSTTWALSGAATTTGGAMLACNKDGALTSPCEWYLCSLNTPFLHVAGATIPGVPGILVGRNEYLAWGSSALKADVQDIYLEQFKSQFDATYKTSSGFKNAQVRTEVIPVRFGKDVEHKVLVTDHGPILMHEGQAAVSLAWSGLRTDEPSFNALFKVNRARSTDELVAAIAKYSDPPMEFIFADRFGNVGLHAAGAIPVRADGGTGTRLNTGWEKKGQWESFIPFEQLPQAAVASSAKGQAAKIPLAAAGQEPESPDTKLLAQPRGQTAGRDRTKTSPAIMLGHQWSPPYRAHRLLTLLGQSKSAVSLLEMLALEGDQYSPVAPLLSETLEHAAITCKLADRTGLYAVKLLERWDGQLTTQGVEGSIYESFLQTFTRRLIEPSLGRELATEYMQRWPLWLTLTQSVLQNQPQKWLAPEERTYDTFVLTTLAQALKSLHITFGTDNATMWNWGAIHRAVFRQLGGTGSSWFARWYRLAPVPVGGAPECINSLDVTFDPQALSYSSTFGPTERLIVDMSDHDKFYQSISTGQSGQVLSAYSKDQLRAWTSVDLLPMAFSPDQLLKQTKHVLNLEAL